MTQTYFCDLEVLEVLVTFELKIEEKKVNIELHSPALDAIADAKTKLESGVKGITIGRFDEAIPALLNKLPAGGGITAESMQTKLEGLGPFGDVASKLLKAEMALTELRWQQDVVFQIGFRVSFLHLAPEDRPGINNIITLDAFGATLEFDLGSGT